MSEKVGAAKSVRRGAVVLGGLMAGTMLAGPAAAQAASNVVAAATGAQTGAVAADGAQVSAIQDQFRASFTPGTVQSLASLTPVICDPL